MVWWAGPSAPWKSTTRKDTLQAHGTAVKAAIITLVFAASCLGQFEGGGGPSILSRGGARPGQAGGKPINFNFYAGLNASYNNGSIPIDTGSSSSDKQVLYGGSLNGGLTGSHAWKSSSIGVDYRGNYRLYSGHSYADGTEQAIDMQYTVQASRRISFNISAVGGTSTNANGGFVAPTAILDPNLIGVPTSNIFDNRMYYGQGTVGMTYRLTSRLRFMFSGDGFTMQYKSNSLIGMNGYRASAQVTYQFSRRDQIGIGYNFTHFAYPRAFGASDLHGISGNYGRKLAPGLDFTLSGGIYRIETLGSAQVTLSPEVAEILGQTTGYQALYRVNYSPQYSGTLTYARRRSTFTGSLGAGVTPGNGVYLTSRSLNVGAGYSYSGIRKVTLSLTAGASQFSSVFQTIEQYRNYYGGASGAYSITRHLSASLQTDVRTFNINGKNRPGYSVTLGIYWSPTEIPIPSW